MLALPSAAGAQVPPTSKPNGKNGSVVAAEERSSFTSLAEALAAGRVEPGVADRLARDGHVDAFVNFDASRTLAASGASAAGSPADKARIATALQEGFGAQKQQAVGALALPVLADYPHLPTTLVTLSSPAVALAVLNSPGVSGLSARALNQPFLSDSLPVIRQPQAAAAGNKGAGTAIAVLDSGVDYTDSAFGSCTSATIGAAGCRVKYVQDPPGFDDGQRDASPVHHGTNVAAIAAAVAPSASIIGMDVFRSDSADDADIIQALDWVVAHNAEFNIKAVNLSLGQADTHFVTECRDSVYANHFLVLRAIGIVPVVAAGNSALENGAYQDGVSSPACAPGAIRVGNVYDGGGLSAGNQATCPAQTQHHRDEIRCTSQSGALLSIWAPGCEISAAGQNLCGTSQAAPHVSGAVAVLAATAPTATAGDIDRALTFPSSGPLIFDDRPTPHTAVPRLDLPDAIAALSRRSNAVVDDPGCRAQSLPANDDGSTPFVDLPFPVNFFGHSYAGLFVNNNGNVTFNQPLAQYTPFALSATTPPIIATFFADVDTRNPASSLVTYGTTMFGNSRAFCVDWVDVGYYASQADKLNSFQLLLVDRSDIAAGDFDIVMNYDRIVWETGSASGGQNGFGGTAAGAGYSAGDQNAAHFFQFEGSLQTTALLDSNAQTGLVRGSRNSFLDGRYIFDIRNGAAPGTATFLGTVTAGNGTPLSAAPVQACRQPDNRCVVASTNSLGQYRISPLDAGNWILTANPPAGSSALAVSAGPIALAAGATVRQDFRLAGPAAPPADTTITNRGTTGDGIPIVYWTERLLLETRGCVGGSASFEIRQGDRVLRSGPMAETPARSGSYVATVQPLSPEHGNAQVRIRITCPNPADNKQTDFTIYIDPSGMVVDTAGNPLAGATVTLLRADTATGPFEVVPSGSAIMSPSNRTNPSITAADGQFAWDVIAGFYKVRAEHSGCVAPGNPSLSFVETPVLPIPPPALGLTLTLSCPPRPVAFTLGGQAGQSFVYATGTPDNGGTRGTVFGLLRNQPLDSTPIAEAGMTTIGGREVLVVRFVVGSARWEIRFRDLFFGFGTMELCGPPGCESGPAVRFTTAGVSPSAFGAFGIHLPDPTGPVTSSTTVPTSTTTTVVNTTTTSSTSTTTSTTMAAGPTTTAAPTTTTVVAAPSSQCVLLQAQLNRAQDARVRTQLITAMRALGCGP